ncbi:sine oculis-binding protein homolog [Anoplophora glabripennis]|uniref:sine oculis-binding protein homolog n=1 Tax=Anoplophora glabripennis TaxID=217634 RepID=UPI0008757316|nr:sine oculis-binding protein homolog [Anoplophora glabripennis]
MEKSATSEVSITKVPVKKENLNDDIKEFAETAMNELLGWYGYENTRDDLKGIRSCRSHSGSNSSGQGSPKFTEGCGWCGKSVDENTGLTSGSATFCSEMCFSQSRRATFKKNKTCDWCRHVRHTVSYVDFQDGASQLQFCSDKCLNQYKMHIFCRETRAHLELHPHMHAEESASVTLITPDLWMKNCKSPELRTPSPAISPKPPEKPPQTSPLPLISVTHPSKLMSLSESPESKRHRLKVQKKTRKRLPSTITCNSFPKAPPNDAPQDLRVRHTPTDFEKRISVEEPPKTLPKEKCLEPQFRPNERLPNPQYFSPNQQPPPTLHPLRKQLDAILPPPTIIVPYPIILPLPIPIPIPIPIPNLLKKENAVKEIERKDMGVQTDESREEVGKDSISNEVVDVVGFDGKEEEEEEGMKKVGRPLRKRKRCEPKARVIIKTRKVISASSN